jgi:hypothetical protein
MQVAVTSSASRLKNAHAHPPPPPPSLPQFNDSNKAPAKVMPELVPSTNWCLPSFSACLIGLRHWTFRLLQIPTRFFFISSFADFVLQELSRWLQAPQP